MEFLETTGSHILVFQCGSDFNLYLCPNICHEKSIRTVMCIDDGVKVWIGPWRGFKFQLKGFRIEF